jgi:hypothetical protein
LRSLGRPRATQREIDEELRFHLEQRAADNCAAGLPPAEAARQARRAARVDPMTALRNE